MKETILLFISLFFTILLCAQNSDYERFEKALESEKLDSANIYLDKVLKTNPRNAEQIPILKFECTNNHKK